MHKALKFNYIFFLLDDDDVDYVKCYESLIGIKYNFDFYYNIIQTV